jgi:hypothetical protein
MDFTESTRRPSNYRPTGSFSPAEVVYKPAKKPSRAVCGSWARDALFNFLFQLFCPGVEAGVEAGVAVKVEAGWTAGATFEVAVDVAVAVDVGVTVAVGDGVTVGVTAAACQILTDWMSRLPWHEPFDDML